MSDTDFKQYVTKKVIVTRNLKAPNDKGELAEEVEGTLVAANAMGVMFTPKGQTKADIISLDEVEDIRLAPEKSKKLSAKKLKPVELGKAKSHLLERHGLKLADVNALSEEDAHSYHEQLDHKALDLGHVHTAEATAAETDAADAESAA
jgi:uncharacterized DUF497 family protein